MQPCPREGPHPNGQEAVFGVLMGAGAHLAELQERGPADRTGYKDPDPEELAPLWSTE